jgi:DNA-binding transcriptional regulator YdaS (Cro superfamily)
MGRKRINKSDQYNTGAIQKAVDIIGGGEKLARLLGTSYTTVLNWKNGWHVPTPINCMLIEKATGGRVKREDILPNYPWEELR